MPKKKGGTGSTTPAPKKKKMFKPMVAKKAVKTTVTRTGPVKKTKK